jgi:hypothetical protein
VVLRVASHDVQSVDPGHDDPTVHAYHFVVILGDTLRPTSRCRHHAHNLVGD